MTLIQKFFALYLLAITTTAAGQTSPHGYWLASDDSSGEPTAIISIVEQGNEIKGFIDKVLVKNHEQDLCTKCEGRNKGIRIQGMQLLGDMKLHNGIWTGGWIIDSENGKTYSASAQLVENGSKLKIEGYIGIPLFGRSKYFRRVDPSQYIAR